MKNKKMTTDLQKEIEELNLLSAQLLEKDLSDSEYWLTKGEIETAKKALLIINQLQEDRDRYEHLWESNSIEAKEIMAEMEDHINKLQEEKKQFRQIGLDWIEIANKQKEEIKQLKEKLNDK